VKCGVVLPCTEVPTFLWTITICHTTVSQARRR